MVVLCAGMFRSGSTWQYQVACDLARRSGRAFWQRGCPPVSADVVKFVRSGLDSPGIHVIKSHVPDPAMQEFFEHPGFRVLYSYRDLRDIAFSMAHKIGDTFETVVHQWFYLDHCLALDAAWAPVPHKVVQRYESWILNPEPFVHQIAECMEIAVNPSAVKAICEEYSLENQKQRIALFAGEVRHRGLNVHDKKYAMMQDEASLLHWNHIREGRVGHWRALATPEQKREMLRICGEWLIAKGYETNHDWAAAEGHDATIPAGMALHFELPTVISVES